MPELPEVETIRRSLFPLVIGHKVVRASLTYAKLLKNAEPEEFSLMLEDQTFTDIKRRGKYMMFCFDSDLRLIVHLRMTGQLRYEDPAVELRKHNHFILDLDNGMQLRYVDTRKFGMLYLGSEDQVINDSGWHRLGPEPLDDAFTLDAFRTIVQRYPHRKIKGLLLDQHMLAGLGNIYTDEALFKAKIHPRSLAGCIAEEAVEALYHAIRTVLAAGIEHRGTSMNDYVDGFGKMGSFQEQLHVYRQTGAPCTLCGNPITRLKVAGRSSHVCVKCQQEYKG